jgi:cell wall-associated NlpC family hydrolase
MRAVRSFHACLPLLAALLLPGCQSMQHAAEEAESAPPAAAESERPQVVVREADDVIAMAKRGTAEAAARAQRDTSEMSALADPGKLAAERAGSLAGIRYRFGGTSPREGFDCSGLIHFSYREAAGVKLPRDTGSLRKASLRIDRHELRPGDLIFFRLRGTHGHVGIYAGEGRFIHAPSRGKKVRFESLEAPFWQKKYAESRRPVI